jgi:membrane-associated phospholipid phosphatase
MPSLHVGWAVLLAIGVAMAFGNAGKKGKRSWLIWFVLLLAVLHPITQWTSTVMTGNHYFLDGVGGLVAAALGLVFATFMQRRGYGWLGRRVTSNQ